MASKGTERDTGRAMSDGNAERLRQGLDAVNRRDKAGWLVLCDPELENVPTRDWPEPDPIRGSEAVWDFFVEVLEPWGEESSPFEFVEVIDLGNDKVVAEMRSELQGKASGASVAWRFWNVGTFRNGTLLRLEWFTDKAEALEAAGVRE
jgi:ketosteroid isomerase-like protein